VDTPGSESFVETEVVLDLEMDRYLKLGDAAFREWGEMHRERFFEQMANVLDQNGF
jgi:hypothetical protein